MRYCQRLLLISIALIVTSDIARAQDTPSCFELYRSGELKFTLTMQGGPSGGTLLPPYNTYPADTTVFIDSTLTVEIVFPDRPPLLELGEHAVRQGHATTHVSTVERFDCCVELPYQPGIHVHIQGEADGSFAIDSDDEVQLSLNGCSFQLFFPTTVGRGIHEDTTMQDFDAWVGGYDGGGSGIGAGFIEASLGANGGGVYGTADEYGHPVIDNWAEIPWHTEYRLTRTAHTDPVGPKWKYTQDQKDQFKRWSEYANQQAAELAIVAPFLALVNPPSGLLVGSVSGLRWRMSIHWDRLAADPPDLNYQVVPSPVYPAVRYIGYEKGLPRFLADAFYRVIGSGIREFATMRAIRQTVDRLQAATDAGDVDWEYRLTSALSAYEAELSRSLAGDFTLINDFVSAASAALPAVTVGPDDILQLIEQFRSTVPDAVVATLRDLGADDQEIADIRAHVLAMSTDGPGVDFPGFLADQTSATNLAITAESLAVKSVNNGVPLACAVDRSSQFRIRIGALYKIAGRGGYAQKITIHNVGDTTVGGPISLVLDDLPRGVEAVNSVRPTTCAAPSAPFVDFAIPEPGSLKPGGAASVVMMFDNPRNVRVRFRPRILSDAGVR